MAKPTITYISELKTETERRNACIEIFLQDAADRVAVEDRWFKNEKLWIAYIDAQTWPYKQRVSVRKCFEFVDTELANFFQATLSANPPFDVNAVKGKDVDRSYLLKCLLLWQQEEGMEFSSEWERFILNGLIYGFSPGAMDWQSIYGYVPKMIDYRMKNGIGSGKIRKNELMNLYTGPGFEAVDPYSIYWRMAASRISRTPHIFHRMLPHYIDIKEAEGGFLKNTGELVGNEGMLINTDFTERINAITKKSGVPPTYTEWIKESRSGEDVTELVYGWFPKENYLHVFNEKTTFYEGEFPYLNAEWPYVFWTNFLNPWGVVGFSTPELIEDQCHETHFLRNSRGDFRNMKLMPMFLRHRLAKIYDEDLDWSPFGRVDTNDMNGLKQIQVFDNNTTTDTMREEQICDDDMANTLGVDRNGPAPASRENRLSTQVRNEAGRTRMGHRLQRLLMVYREVLRKQHRLNRQFMNKKTLVRILGEELKGYIEVSPEDIMRDYDFVITPSVAYGNRNARREDWLQFAQVCAAIPPLYAIMPWGDIGKGIAEDYDMRGIRAKIDMTLAAQQRAVEMGKGGTPGGATQGPPQQGGGGVAETALAKIGAGVPEAQAQ